MGYTGTTHTRRCRHHDYVHYTSGWTDPNSGKYYDAGYYDENGNYYRGLTVKSGNTYSSEFACEYCGSLAKYTWNEGAVPNCENCGAPLTMINSFAQDEEAPTTYVHDSSSFGGSGATPRGISVIVVAAVAVITMVMTMVTSTVNKAGSDSSYTSYSSYDDSNIDGNVDIYGSDIYLVSNGDGSYSIIEDSSSYDKNIFYDYNSHSYWDPDTDAYLWFNTDVRPSLWQYWDEGYSSDYGYYGWMEHEDDGWWIETYDGNWEKVPQSDAAEFWWIK